VITGTQSLIEGEGMVLRVQVQGLTPERCKFGLSIVMKRRQPVRVQM
jgi:hypothetical protein